MSATKEHHHNEIEDGMRPAEHPILFSTDMVKANLERRKRMTRRTRGLKNVPQNVTTIDRYNKTGQFTMWNKKRIVKQIGESPYGKPGDLLWVRETWGTWKNDLYFRASTEIGDELCKWKPSIHMPKEAARIWLEVVSVRVERLQSISEEDAKAEGAQKAILWMNTQQIEYVDEHHIAYPTASHKLGFQKLWISINGIESWHENPWVWVVEYKVLSTTGRPESK